MGDILKREGLIVCTLVNLILHSAQASPFLDSYDSRKVRSDCTDVAAQASFQSVVAPSGKYLLNVGPGRRPVWAYCDMDTDNGGWTVIQRRQSSAVDFYRNWKEYEQGFGDPLNDHWLGNTYIHSLTASRRYVLRIELTDWENNVCISHYNNFAIAEAAWKYSLESVGKFTGECGDSLTYQLGQKFSTYDQDNDVYSNNCAQEFHGAWWYKSCHESNLNGRYFDLGFHSSYADGINWKSGKGHYYSYKKVEMKIRAYGY